MKPSLRKTLLFLSLATLPGAGVLPAAGVAKAAPSQSNTGIISGTVENAADELPIEGAIVVIQCSCLSEELQRMTNARGIYSFRELPAGRYTIRVLTGKGNVSRSAQLPRGGRFRANFQIDPDRGARKKAK